jgi:MFS family permease
MTARLQDTSPRRLVPILLLFESALYSAVTPVLPHYARVLHASKPAIGVLAASYAAGLIPGGLLGGWLATRSGVCRTTLAGLIAFAVAVAPFGFVSGIAVLDSLRVLQGVAAGCIWGGALTWVMATSPRAQRGQVIGTAIAAATFGTLLGPALGTLAVAAGTGPAFAAVGVVSLLLGGWVALQPEPRQSDPDPHEAHAPIGQLLRSRAFVLGTWLVGLEAITIGAANTLLPLRLARFGASGIAIGATFLGAAAVSTLLAPVVGRITDRRGPFGPIRVGLVLSALLTAALVFPSSALALAVLSVIALGVPLTGYLTPAATLITESADAAGIALAVATMTLNLAYALGETIGAPAGATISQATSDTVVFLVLAAIMALTLLGSVAMSRAGDQHRAVAPARPHAGAAA